MGIKRKVLVPITTVMVVDDDDFPDMSDEEIAKEVANKVFQEVYAMMDASEAVLPGYMDDCSMERRDTYRGPDKNIYCDDGNFGDWYAPWPTCHLLLPDGGSKEQYSLIKGLWRDYRRSNRTNGDIKALIVLMQSVVSDQCHDLMNKLQEVLNNNNKDSK